MYFNVHLGLLDYYCTVHNILRLFYLNEDMLAFFTGGSKLMTLVIGNQTFIIVISGALRFLMLCITLGDSLDFF